MATSRAGKWIGNPLPTYRRAARILVVENGWQAEVCPNRKLRAPQSCDLPVCSYGVKPLYYGVKPLFEAFSQGHPHR